MPCQHDQIEPEDEDADDQPAGGPDQPNNGYDAHNGHGLTNGHDATDPNPGSADDEEEEGSGFNRWRRESVIGEVGTGIAKGLRNIFGPVQDEIVIMAAVPGDPPDADQRVRVILDPDDPTKSIAIIPESQAHPPDDARPPPPDDDPTPSDQD